MKKMFMALILGGAVITGSAGVSSAAEWNPSRGYIHVDENGDQVQNPGKSICSYSGREDPDDDRGFWQASAAKGRVQSPGQVVTILGPGAAGIPGHECRGNLEHG